MGGEFEGLVSVYGIILCTVVFLGGHFHIHLFTDMQFIDFIAKTRIRSVERGICPIAALCTVLFYCPDVQP